MGDINKPLMPISRVSFVSVLKKYVSIFLSFLFLCCFIFFIWFVFFDHAVEVVPSKKTHAQIEHTEKAVSPALDNKEQDKIIVRNPLDIDKMLEDKTYSYLPEKDIIENTAQGPLPIISGDGRKSLAVYARVHSPSIGAKLSIVVGGIGISQTNSLKAIETLPPAVTLAFAAHGNSLGHWMKKARMAGHELIMQVPMEPYGYPNINPGLHTLRVESNEDTQMQDLRWALSRTTNYIGVMNYMGARFLSDYDSVAILMKEIGARGLLFFDDGTSPQSSSSLAAIKSRVPFAKADVVLDDVLEKAAILKKLRALEDLALTKGKAIGVASSFVLSIDVLSEWIETLYHRNIELVPLSSLVQYWEDKVSFVP